MTRNTRLRVIRPWPPRLVVCALAGLACVAAVAARADEPIPSTSTHALTPPPPAAEKPLTQEEKFRRRYPQPVRVGDLIGLPVLDDDDWTIGFVREVVRSPDGKVMLIVPYNSWWNWADIDWGKHPVAVPIEVVTILARQLDSVDMSRTDFDKAPTWQPSEGKPIDPNDKTLIALGRR